MSKSPIVSVILPVCNGQLFIVEAINSIRNQTFSDFELIVIDNASSDATPSLIKEVAEKDNRIRVLTNESNIGVVGSLNRGLRETRGIYYARMDGDDIALPTRLAKQVAYMENHPEVVAVGSWGEKFGDAEGRMITAVTPAEIRATMLFMSPIIHPSSMLRISVLRDNQIEYRRNTPIEDFDMWVRLSRLGNLAALPIVLLKYRIHNASIRARSSSFIRGALRVVLRDALESYLEPRGLSFLLSDNLLELHSRFSCQEKMNIRQYCILPFWLAFLVVVSGNLVYFKVVAKRTTSYLLVAIRGRLLPRPEIVFNTHSDIERFSL